MVRKDAKAVTAVGAATIGTGAAVGAGIASVCCAGPAIAPLLLPLLGASGLIALADLRLYAPVLLLLSAVVLAWSFRQSYRKAACAAGGMEPAIPLGIRVARAICWAAASLWVLSSAYALYGIINER